MNQIRQYCEHYGFESAVTDHLDAAWQQLTANSAAYAVFLDQIEVYKKDMSFDYHPVFDRLHTLEEQTGIHSYTIDLLYLIAMMPLLKAHYIERGYPLRYLDCFASNLKSYIRDCQNTYDVCGTYIGWWLIAFFKLKLFSIGRLQYKPKVFLKDRGNEQFPLKEGQPYLDVHVPPDGPLTPELCHASYAEAAEFFRQHFGYTEVIICASSWLLSPDLEDMLPARSNILAWAHDYTLLEVHIDENYHSLHFIFDIPSLPEDLNDLPDDSSLRRAVKAHLMAGNKLKTGFGAFRYE